MWDQSPKSKTAYEAEQHQNKQPAQKMGKRREKTFLQRGHADGQQAHAKMFNTASYQRNANQNYNEISPHRSEWLSKNPQTTNAGKGVERKPS